MLPDGLKRWRRGVALVALPAALLAVLVRFLPQTQARGPFVPERGDQVVERLPLLARDPEALELRALERAVAAEPDAVAPRVALASKCIELYRRQSDPRYLGRAQAALGTAFDAASPPSRVRLLRAVVRQSNHEFLSALADLDVLVAELPDDPQPWLVRAVVLGVLGRYSEAERDCERTRVLSGGLVAAVCLATPLGMSGHGEEARRALLAGLAGSRALGSAERAWALSALAELEVSLGSQIEARRHFDAALALAPNDPYTLAAYADLELDRGEPRRVLELVGGFERVDALLLRLTLAERRLQLPGAADRARELGARYAAARLRGDVTHRREEARYVLDVAREPTRALELALANWDVQKERGDARVLLEAALAAGKLEAARPVVEFVERTGSKDVTLRALIARVRGAS